MRISDKTPFRDSSGQISLIGRLQGSLKYGFSWYAEQMAQEKVIAIFNKILDRNYILLRNFILPETDITIPLLLIGPSGIYLISVLHQSGLYSIRDDEWGKLAGATFSPARVNLVDRLVKLGRVVKTYLNRSGFKGELIVEPIMIAANSGMHIEPVRPAARAVLSDAIERFVISLTQARPTLSADRIADIALALVKGPPDQTSVVSGEVPAGKEIRDKVNPLEAPAEDIPANFSGDNLGFSFDEHWNDDQGQFDQAAESSNPQSGADQNRQSSSNTPAFEGFNGDFNNFFENADIPVESNESQPGNPQEPAETEPTPLDEPAPDASTSPSPSAPAQKRRFGMSNLQLIILAGIFVVWLLLIVAFILLINF